tara:strand:+ start:462 stop:1202 length:741 start_codon:yes stop_codon:yes gene_type:complete
MDVVELQKFYFRTELGIKVVKVINKTLKPIIEKNSAEFLIGFGFACPYLEQLLTTPDYETSKKKMVSLMPGEQGVIPWPKNGKNVSVLVDETSWPINTSSADLIVMAHGLEVSGNQKDLLQESYRVLSSKGKLVLLVPNRTGFWARSDNTPFGFGKPYSVNQLNLMLSQNQFQIENISPALYGLPSHKGYWLTSLNFWETVGKRFNYPFFGGLLIVEASKSCYGAQKLISKKTRKIATYGKAVVTS